jgi:hypothetical protein
MNTEENIIRVIIQSEKTAFQNFSTRKYKKLRVKPNYRPPTIRKYYCIKKNCIRLYKLLLEQSLAKYISVLVQWNQIGINNL